MRNVTSKLEGSSENVAGVCFEFGNMNLLRETKRNYCGGFAALLQGLCDFCGTQAQAGARFTSLALGYNLSGFQPFEFGWGDIRSTLLIKHPHLRW